MKKTRKTAAELMAELQGDPEFLTRAQVREQTREREVEANRAAAAPMLADLASHGWHYSSIAELREQGGVYTEAVPVLLKWLPLMSNRDVKESIVRALSVPFAEAAAPALVAEFQRAPADQMLLKWAIGNALSVVAADSEFADIAALAQDARHGKAREMLAVALGNMKTTAAAAIEVLLGLLADDEVAGHAVMALGQLRAGSARQAIEALLRKQPKPWVRKEAEKALKRISAG